jgi:hypothetical protein
MKEGGEVMKHELKKQKYLLGLKQTINRVEKKPTRNKGVTMEMINEKAVRKLLKEWLK